MDEMQLTDEQLDRLEKLDKLGKKILAKKEKAIKARRASGIEEIWREDEEFYEGVDEANRLDTNTLITKDTADRQSGFGTRQPKRTGSNVFLNITRPYVENASASLAEMLMPIEELPFDLKPTPIPELADIAKQKGMMMETQQGPQDAGQLAKQALAEADKKAESAQLKIEDWLIECQWNAEVRKVIQDAVKLGTGILKGPFPVKRKSKKLTEAGQGAMQLEIVIETKPASKRIDPRNFYPDPACCENIHNGSFVFEKDTLSGKQLRELMGTIGEDGTPYYLDEQIKRVLKEGPNRVYEEKNKLENHDDKYDVWYYYGTATKDDLQAVNIDIKEDHKAIDVFMVIVNGHVIKAARSVLDSGEFPFDVMVYQPRCSTWTGIGLARQIREPQRMINALIRNMLDNAGIGGSPILVLGEGVEMEGGGPIVIGRNTILRLSPDSPIQNAQQAVQPIVIPIISQELINLFQLAQKMAEDVTGMPLMLQGQQGSAPDTVGGMQILQQNSGATRRNIAKLFDDRVIVPHIQRFYEWLLIYGDDEDKGDFQIHAKGSTSFFERDASKMALIQMGAMLSNPAFGIDPAKYMKEVLKAHRINSETILYSEEELAKMQEQQGEQPQDPSLQVAQIRAQTEQQKAQADQQMQQMKLQFEQAENQRQREHEMQLAILTRDMKVMELSQNENISIQQINADLAKSSDQVKARLAETAQKLNVQTVLSHNDMQLQHKKIQATTPPTEPIGRAQPGHAWQQ